MVADQPRGEQRSLAGTVGIELDTTELSLRRVKRRLSQLQLAGSCEVLGMDVQNRLGDEQEASQVEVAPLTSSHIWTSRRHPGHDG